MTGFLRGIRISSIRLVYTRINVIIDAVFKNLNLRYISQKATNVLQMIKGFY